jgi:hypothetical protein
MLAAVQLQCLQQLCELRLLCLSMPSCKLARHWMHLCGRASLVYAKLALLLNTRFAQS